MIKNINYNKLLLKCSDRGDNLGIGKTTKIKKSIKRTIKRVVRSKLNRIFKIHYDD